MYDFFSRISKILIENHCLKVLHFNINIEFKKIPLSPKLFLVNTPVNFFENFGWLSLDAAKSLKKYRFRRKQFKVYL